MRLLQKASCYLPVRRSVAAIKGIVSLACMASPHWPAHVLIVLLSLQFKTLPNCFCCDQDKLLIKFRLHFRTVAACMVLARPRMVLTSSVNATELCYNWTEPCQHSTPHSGSPLPAQFDWGVVYVTSLIHLWTATATCTTGEKQSDMMAYWMDKEMLKLTFELWGQDSIQAELQEA